MANRSHLYAGNYIPDGERRELIGISEWNWDIPLIHKILISGSPRACRSTIWDIPDKIAIVGNYSEGVEKLRAFLGRIEREDARPLIDEALQFLDDEANRREYVVLECGEIYELGSDEDFARANAALIDEVFQIENTFNAALESLKPRPPRRPTLGERFRKWVRDRDRVRLRPEGPPDPLEPVYRLGLGNWSNILYYDCSK